jgi:DNA processing protein
MSEGGLSEAERLDRVLLARVIEPGEELGGRWLRQIGARETARRLTEAGKPLPGASPKRWA